MNVVLEVVRALEIDDQDNTLNVETSSTYARCNHDVSDSLLEVIDGKLSVSWIHGTVKY